MNKRRLIYTISTIIWMLVIFYFSSQPAEESGSLSGFVWQKIIGLFTMIFGRNVTNFIASIILNEHFIRKCGHFIEYFILGILCSLTLKEYKIKKTWLVSGIFCILYAGSDELHQVFVPGRGPAVADTLLDSLASFTGIAITLVMLKKKSRPRA